MLTTADHFWDQPWRAPFAVLDGKAYGLVRDRSGITTLEREDTRSERRRNRVDERQINYTGNEGQDEQMAKVRGRLEDRERPYLGQRAAHELKEDPV